MGRLGNEIITMKVPQRLRRGLLSANQPTQGADYPASGVEGAHRLMLVGRGHIGPRNPSARLERPTAVPDPQQRARVLPDGNLARAL
jgi:hypothetical protein